jgi:glutamate-1-semialdehyde 2,1-aminomutase
LDSHHGDDEDCLVKLREIADDAGLTLVCDETITGFRHALGGLHTKLGIAPDLVVFAETLSHGLSFGLIVGRASYLDSAVNVLPQDALLADPIGLAAASMIVRFMTDTDVVSKITLLAHQLRSGITRLAMDTGLSPVLHCGGTGSHVHVAFGSAGNTTAAEFAAAFQQGSVRRGVLTDALSLYPSYGHEKETIDRALRVYIDVFEEIGKKC